LGPIQPIPHKVVFICVFFVDGCFYLALSASLMAKSHSVIKAIKFSCSHSSECWKHALQMANITSQAELWVFQLRAL